MIRIQLLILAVVIAATDAAFRKLRVPIADDQPDQILRRHCAEARGTRDSCERIASNASSYGYYYSIGEQCSCRLLAVPICSFWQPFAASYIGGKPPSELMVYVNDEPLPSSPLVQYTGYSPLWEPGAVTDYIEIRTRRYLTGTGVPQIQQTRKSFKNGTMTSVNSSANPKLGSCNAICDEQEVACAMLFDIWYDSRGESVNVCHLFGPSAIENLATMKLWEPQEGDGKGTRVATTIHIDRTSWNPSVNYCSNKNWASQQVTTAPLKSVRSTRAMTQTSQSKNTSSIAIADNINALNEGHPSNVTPVTIMAGAGGIVGIVAFALIMGFGCRNRRILAKQVANMARWEAAALPSDYTIADDMRHPVL